MSSGSVLERAVALVFLGAQMTACTSWTTQSVSPEEFFRGKTAYEVQITRADSTKVVLTQPRLVGDRVLGDSVATTPSPERTVPLADIRSVAVRRKDPTKTTLFVVGLGVTAGVMVAVLDDPPETFIALPSGSTR